MQGMTELTECVRTEDPWLYDVQEEMRAGDLSIDAWNFLHGLRVCTQVGRALYCT